MSSVSILMTLHKIQMLYISKEWCLEYLPITYRCPRVLSDDHSEGSVPLNWLSSRWLLRLNAKISVTNNFYNKSFVLTCFSTTIPSFHTYIHIYAYTQTQTHAHAHTTNKHIYIYIYLYTYIFTHMHIYIQIICTIHIYLVIHISKPARIAHILYIHIFIYIDTSI